MGKDAATRGTYVQLRRADITHVCAVVGVHGPERQRPRASDGGSHPLPPPDPALTSPQRDFREYNIQLFLPDHTNDAEETWNRVVDVARINTAGFGPG